MNECCHRRNLHDKELPEGVVLDSLNPQDADVLPGHRLVEDVRHLLVFRRHAVEVDPAIRLQQQTDLRN